MSVSDRLPKRPVWSLAAALLLGGLASVAAAVSPTVAPNDLIMGFRATGGTGASKNLEVDLGNVTAYASAKGTITLSQLAAADLSSTYGANWSSRIGKDLFWGVFGATGNTNADKGPTGQPKATLWATTPQTAPDKNSPGGTSTPWPRLPTAVQISGSDQMLTVYGSAPSPGSLNAATSASTAESAVVDTGLVGSWSYTLGSGGDAFTVLTPTTLFDNPGAGYNYHSADLYEMQPAVAVTPPPGTLLGTFTLSSAGLLTFTSAAPATAGSPTITTQPASQTVQAGATATFSVVATSTPASTLTYQWSKDGTAISGATGASYAIAGVLAADAGNYTVTVTNSVGSITSAPATLTLQIPGFPNITTQPVAQEVTVGLGASFSVVATGNDPLSYQWSKDGTPIGGATSATYTIPLVRTVDAGSYSVTVTNPVGSLISSSVTLTVDPRPPLTIATPPASQIVPLGASATFTVVASGVPAPTYRWTKDGIFIPGATNAFYSIGAVQSSDVGNYAVVATNSTGSVSSSAASLTIAAPPVIVQAPLSQTVAIGASVTLNATASGLPDPVYQWNLNGTPIAGATSASFSLSSAQTTDSGRYSVTISNVAGSVTSAAATLTVQARSFAGVYFGNFGSNDSLLALHVRADNSGLLVGYLGSSHTAVIGQVKLDQAGVLSGNVTLDQPVSAGAQTASSALPVTGQISGGSLSGQITGGTQAFMGQLDSPGAAQGLAGAYVTNALMTAAGKVYLVVGPSGQTLLLADTPTVVEGGLGTIAANGQVSVHVPTGLLSAAVNPQTRATSSTFTLLGDITTWTFAGAPDDAVATSRLANISTRGFVLPGGSLTPGFALRGTGSKQLVVRAVGSTLGQLGIGAPLPDPRLDIQYTQGSSAVTISNDNWGGVTALASAFVKVGAFPLPATSSDAAVQVSLAPVASNYTVRVTPTGAGVSGVVLAEIYDADPQGAAVRLTNLSTLGFSGLGEQTLTAGFVIDGNVPKRVLIRAVGPGLAQFLGAATVLADPQLQVFQSGQPYVLAANDDWGGTATLKSAFLQAGAFSLADSSKDAALVLTLAPGVYTAAVTGVGNTTGQVLIELYDLDP